MILKYAPMKEDVVCRMESLRSEWDPLTGTCEVGTENWYCIGTSKFWTSWAIIRSYRMLNIRGLGTM